MTFKDLMNNPVVFGSSHRLSPKLLKWNLVSEGAKPGQSGTHLSPLHLPCSGSWKIQPQVNDRQLLRGTEELPLWLVGA